MKKYNNNPLIIAVLAGLTGCTFCLLCFGLILVAGYFIFTDPGKSGPDNGAQIAGQESQENLPASSLLGIWQKNGFMAAGWDDRYHFYPSGTFHYYPNQMTCVTEKIGNMGTWKLEGNVLTLTTTEQIINSFEIDTGGLCRVIGKKQVVLSRPTIEQFTVVDRGTQEGDIYPSMLLNDQIYWKFSEDASSYGDEKFPESEYP